MQCTTALPPARIWRGAGGGGGGGEKLLEYFALFGSKVVSVSRQYVIRLLVGSLIWVKGHLGDVTLTNPQIVTTIAGILGYNTII